MKAAPLLAIYALSFTFLAEAPPFVIAPQMSRFFTY